MPRSTTTIVTGAAALVAAGALALTGASLAKAGSTPSVGASSTEANAVVAQANDYGYGYGMGPGQGGMRGPGRGMHNHTEVTGDELAKVTAAVKAKDSAVSVTKVLKDEDGSYDVVGVKAGSPVMVEVSKDLATVEVRQPGPGRGFGRGGMGTPVSADVLAKIAAAVKAKDAGVTVDAAAKLADGSYRAMGAKADGTRVMATLDANLKVTDLSVRSTRGPGGRGGMTHSHTAVTGDELAKVSAAVKAKDSAVSVTKVLKDEDGSYDVVGVKAGARVMVEVSKDLATVEVREFGPGMRSGAGTPSTSSGVAVSI